MPILLLRFPGGRYHATPWGSHVNEGQIEWPPSPWRLLRALIACGYNTLHWESLPPAAVRLIESLAGVLPTYRLPAASPAHTRHYMPLGKLDKGREATALVFDTWANVGDGEMAVRWNCELDAESQELFAELASNLGYLGRSESWVEARAIEDNALLPVEWDAYPHAEGHRPRQGWEQVSMLAAEEPRHYAAWRETVVATAIAGISSPTDAKKPTKKQLEKLQQDKLIAVAPYPEDLLNCLQRDTAWWKQHRWSQPPGSRQVLYWRRSDAMMTGVPQQSVHPPHESIEMMLLSLTTPSGNTSALPPCSRTLPQAELLHRAIVSRVAKGERVICPELTGQDELGEPLRNGHQHAHILPLDLDGDSHLDHILIYAPMGLGHAAQNAIRAVRYTWAKKRVDPIQLALVGRGQLDDLRSLSSPLKDRFEQLLGPSPGAKTWVSATPFIPPRHLKSHGRNSLIGQIEAELASRKLPEANEIAVLPWADDRLPLRHYVRRRYHGGSPPPIDVGFVIKIHFSQPIHGPLTLGYAAHFGIGAFRSEAI